MLWKGALHTNGLENERSSVEYFVSEIFTSANSAGMYMFRVNNKSTKTICGICSKLGIKTTERCSCHCSGVCIVNFEYIPIIFQVFALLTLNR